MSNKTSNTSISAFVPVKAPDLDVICEGDRLFSDSIRLIYHQVHLVTLILWNRDVDDQPNFFSEGWVPICTSTLKSILYSHRYKENLDFMIKKGLLEVRLNENNGDSYIIGKRCKLYRVPKNLYSRIQRGHLYRKESVITPQLIRNVKSFYNERKYGIDYERNRKFYPDIEKLVKMTQTITPIAAENLDQMELNEIDYSIMELMIESHDKFLTTTIKLDSFGNRFYSPITFLKSNLRGLYSFKGLESKKIELCDVSNSNPYFLGVLCRFPKVVRKYIPEWAPIIPILNKVSDNQDTIHFFELVQSGMFYEWFVKQIENGFTRKRVKILLFQTVFFGRLQLNPTDENYEDHKRFKEIFKIHFPSVDWVIVQIKSLGKEDLHFMDEFYYSRKTGSYLGNGAAYKNLCCCITRLESRIIVGAITTRLVKMRITPFTLIHDCWFTIEDNSAEIVRQVEIFFNRLNIPPPKLTVTELY